MEGGEGATEGRGSNEPNPMGARKLRNIHEKGAEVRCLDGSNWLRARIAHGDARIGACIARRFVAAGALEASTGSSRDVRIREIGWGLPS